MIIAANWKMNPPLADAGALAAAYAASPHDGVTRILFPPAPYLVQMAMRLDGSDVHIGGQDCHQAESGAHTGDVAAHMLLACGADRVLLGHSERREAHGERDELIAAKATTAMDAGLSVMICVGETLDQRKAGTAESVVTSQLDGSVPQKIDADRLMLAYEPVWAIGTGEVAGVEDIAAMHASIRFWLGDRGMADVPVLYGGSVKPENADAIFAVENVDGALVGGASLKAADFDAICSAAARAAVARGR
ncbi:MAG: triose-phosphate isomerase [Candidatus Puniceispirillaceae bacterium]